jgi:hypothetical protein
MAKKCAHKGRIKKLSRETVFRCCRPPNPMVRIEVCEDGTNICVCTIGDGEKCPSQEPIIRIVV